MDNTIWERYRSGVLPLPEKSLSWFLYGAGLENFGRDAAPEAGSPQANDDASPTPGDGAGSQ